MGTHGTSVRERHSVSYNLRKDVGRTDPEVFETCFAERTGQVHKKIIGEVDKGHGRIEHRTYYLATDLSGLATANEWTGLKANGIVRSCVAIGETETTETCYAIT